MKNRESALAISAPDELVSVRASLLTKPPNFTCLKLFWEDPPNAKRHTNIPCFGQEFWFWVSSRVFRPELIDLNVILIHWTKMRFTNFLLGIYVELKSGMYWNC